MSEKEEMREEIKEISNAVAYGLKISRVPARTYERFLALAKAEFADDYGMTLKFLMDFYTQTLEWMGLTDRLLNLVFTTEGEEDELSKGEDEGGEGK